METSLIPIEIQKKINGEISDLVSGSSTITIIETNPQHDNALALTKTIKVLAKNLEEDRDALVRPKNAEVKEINDWFKIPAQRLRALEDNLKAEMKKYQDRMEQLRLEEQRKSDEDASKEREKIEAQARAQREKEAAMRRAEEESRLRKEAAKRAQEEAELRVADAQNAKARKKAQEEAAVARKQATMAAAEELAEKQKADSAASAAALKEAVADLVVPVVVAPKMEKPNGSFIVTTYTGNLINKPAAIKYCLENGKLHLVSLDMGIINKMVKAEKENFSMPGIEVIKNQDMRIKI
jgi:chemotaxis protein histidine kinase CheA